MAAPASVDKICIIFNPTAKGEGARRALRHLHQLERGCAFKPTLAAGTARPLATEAVAEGYETIVAMGGDGTVNEVLNGLADAPEGLARARLAVLPVGTVNVFARELRMPMSFKGAWQVIREGKELLMDLPQMTFHNGSASQQRCFAQMAGCGLDARAVELMDWKWKKRIGQFAYVLSGLKALREKAASIRVTDGTRDYTGQLVLVGNGRFYGGPIPVFERGNLADGLLDVCVFPKVNGWVLLRYACAFLSPRLLVRQSEHHFQASSIRITSSELAPLEVDGEVVGHVPASCSVRPGVLRTVVP
jgi:YegS/Rv2252/BmrU family lipid kinase